MNGLYDQHINLKGSNQHEMFHIDGLTDLAKMRIDAIRYSTNCRLGNPSRVTLHHHGADESCKGREHEVFDIPTKEENDNGAE